MTANQEALAFEREREATRRAEYDKAYGTWLSGRNTLLQRYGIDIAPPSAPGTEGPGGPPGMAGGSGVGAAPGGMPGMAQRAVMAQRGVGGPQGGSIADMVGAAGPQAPAGEDGGWSDWRRYGLRQA
jgi:hypothetical protein